MRIFVRANLIPLLLAIIAMFTIMPTVETLFRIHKGLFADCPHGYKTDREF